MKQTTRTRWSVERDAEFGRNQPRPSAAARRGVTSSKRKARESSRNSPDSTQLEIFSFELDRIPEHAPIETAGVLEAPPSMPRIHIPWSDAVAVPSPGLIPQIHPWAVHPQRQHGVVAVVRSGAAAEDPDAPGGIREEALFVGLVLGALGLIWLGV